MKKIVSRKSACICIAFLLLVALLGVGKAYFFPSRVNPILLARIEADYAEYHGMKNGPKIQYCYGIYNGCVPVMLHHAGYDTGWKEEVSNHVFYYGDGFGARNSGINVWRDGVFLTLQEAYSQGYLSKEDIASIWDEHEAQYWRRG